MFQSSFSIIDQIMIGQLGSISVAGVGLAGKFSSIFSVLASAIGAVAGIMISQYLGQKNKQEVRRSFYLNLLIVMGMASVFTFLCIAFPRCCYDIDQSGPGIDDWCFVRSVSGSRCYRW